MLVGSRKRTLDVFFSAKKAQNERWEVVNGGHLRTNRLSHTQQRTTTTKELCHHGPPKPLASNGSNFTGEYNCRMLRNRSRSLQHGDITYIDKTYCSVILFRIILQAVAWRTRGQKVSLISYYLCFFWCNCTRLTRTNLSYPAIFYLPIPHEY